MKTQLIALGLSLGLAASAAAQDRFPFDHGQVLPQSETRLLTVDELFGLSDADLRIARNEIFARHGFVFQSEDLQAHFGAIDWYVPNPDLVLRLTSLEQSNVTLIRLIEESRQGEGQRLSDLYGISQVTWRGEVNVGAEIYGRGMEVFRIGGPEAGSFSIQTTSLSRTFDLSADRGVGVEQLRPQSHILFASETLGDAVVTATREDEVLGEQVIVASFELYGQPITASRSEEYEELRLDRDWTIGETTNGPAVWGTHEGYIARTRLSGEVWITPDGIVLNGYAEGAILYYDYDGWEIDHVDDGYLLNRFERLETPDGFFTVPDEAVSDFIYPG